MSGFRYGEFERVQFRKPPFRPLSPFAKLVYLTLVVGPDGTTLPGLVESDAYKLAGDTKLTVEQVKSALAELTKAAMVEVDADHCLIALCGVPAPAPGDTGEANTKVLVGWWNVWEQLPPSPMKLRHVAALRAACNLNAVPKKREDGKNAKSMAEAWAETFGRVEADQAPDRPPEHQPERQPDRQPDRQSDRQSDQQPDRKSDPRPDPSVQRTASANSETSHPALPRAHAGQGSEPVVESLDWRLGLEQRWITGIGIGGFGAPGLPRLALLIEGAASAAGMEPLALFDRAVAEFKAYAALPRKSRVPLTPNVLCDRWVDVWERISPSPETATGPPAGDAPKNNRRRRGNSVMGSAPVGDFQRPRDPDEC